MFPVSMRLRLDNFGEDDFGASAFLQRAKAGVEYVLFDADSFLLQECTEVFYRKVLKLHFGREPQQARSVDVRRLFMQFWAYDAKQNWPREDERVHTLVVVPQAHQQLAFLQQHHGNAVQQLLKQVSHVSLKSYAFIEVQLNVGKTTSCYGEPLFSYVAVHGMKRLTQVRDKVEALNTLKAALNRQLGLDLKLASVQNSGSDLNTHKFTTRGSYYYQSGVTFCRTIESGRFSRPSIQVGSLYGFEGPDQTNYSAKTGKASSSELNRLMS